MNKNTVEGATQKLVGEAQEGVGKAAHNDKLIAKGLANRGAGMAKETAGKAETAVKKALK